MPTLDTAILDTISDQDLTELMQSYADAVGIILDLRRNSGGNELHARRIASYFVAEPTLYGYFRTRTDSEPEGLTPFAAKEVTPHATLRLTCPVVVLVGQQCLSSAEWMALMFREAPNAILMGDRTRGGTANALLRSIPELGVSYTVSRWTGYTIEKLEFEDRGIPPAIYLAAEASFDDGQSRDFLLEHAMEYIDWRQRIGNATQGIDRLSESDGDLQFDTAEFVAGTNPLDPTSSLRLSILAEENGLRIRWPEVESPRSFTIQRRARVTDPWSNLMKVDASSGQAFLPLPPGDFAQFRVEASLKSN